MHDTPRRVHVCARACVVCVCVQAGLSARGDCGVVTSCGRCHKPQDVESHLSLYSLLHTHACARTHTHAVCMLRQGQTLIIGLEELPGAAHNLLIENLTKHTRTHTHEPGLSKCSIGHKISYFTMILHSSQSGEICL